jgi:S-formylglutathione hydrolase
MKRISFVFLAVLFLLVAFNTFNAEPVRADYELIEIPSPSLADALINPRQTYKISVNLPASYNTSEERFPVVYYLNGYTVHSGEYPLTSAVNGAMENNSVREMIVVEISGHNMLQGTMYANSPVTGNWENFVTKDVITYIDQNYRTIAKRASRGIVGHSMGGAGCTNISLKHSDKYAVAYPMSPAIGEGRDAIVEMMFANDSIMMWLDDISTKMLNVSNKDFQKVLTKVIDTSNYNLTWVLGYGMAFAPDLSQPLRMKLPYDKQENGSYVINEANYADWANGFGGLDLKVEKYKQNLLQYKHYSIDCGQSDNLQFIIDGTKYYTGLLSDNNIPYSMDWYDGDHTNKVGDQVYSRVLPIMSLYLERE